MSTRPPLIGKLLVLVVVWVVLAAIGAVLYRFVIAPAQEEQLIAKTSAPTPYERSLSIGLDAFSGYAVLRSARFADLLGEQGVGLDLVDDEADYQARLAALADGSVPIAAFPIDALISASAAVDSMPGVIVLLLDETVGADALVAYRRTVPDLDSLDHADARFVVTPDSPSETLARIARNQFALTAMPAQAWEERDGAAAVLAELRAADPGLKRAYALWEPYVSAALEDERVHVLLDSSRFRGYIVDALVVSRQFLDRHPDDVDLIVRSYLGALHHYRRDPDSLKALIAADADLDGTAVDRLVDGIWWKHTQDNFAHFRLGDAGDHEPLDAIVAKITRLLRDTGAIASDPAAGQPNRWYFPGILAALQQEGFHPGRIGDDRDDQNDIAVAAVDWQQLRPIGTVQLPDLVFGRGTATLTRRSGGHLDELVATLQDWPGALLVIRGHARPEGDAEANRRLAEQRATAVRERLQELGVDPERMRTTVDLATGSQTVSFMLGTAPY